jgi:hypothetical protein
VFAGKPYTAVVKITLDQVKDPAPKPPIVPGTVTLPAGDRMIELKVTVANVGSQAVYGGARYEPMLTYVVGPAMRTQYGLPLYVPFVHGLPEGNGSTAAPGDCYSLDYRILAPGATFTLCPAFYLPMGLPVTSASVLLQFAGTASFGSQGEWLIP